MYRVRSEQIDLLVGVEHPLWVQRVDTRAARRGEQSYALETPGALMHKRVRYDKTARWLRGADPEVRVPSTSRVWTRSDNGARCLRTYPGRAFPARAFAAFLGYFISEGSINGNQIILAQNRGPVLDAMVRVLGELGLSAYVPASGHGCVRTQCVQLRDYLAPLGRAVDKQLPREVQDWAPEIIRVLIEAMVEGDGTTHAASGHRVIYTASEELAGGIQVLAVKAGISANIRIDDRIGLLRVMPNGQSFRNIRQTYVVSLVSRRNRPLVNHGRSQSSRYWNKDGYNDGVENYSGGLHGAAVPWGLLLVRRNGKIVVSGAGSNFGTGGRRGAVQGR
ncbi:LAGLIDADG family homing endonuclease [Actinomadura sp. K4S16]|uniref:LAGLIDADG family homing endonuclease n=1 Tax=Actinomadura sp. K4S16 TaxID=1316147 RepID=UPI0011EE776F|nr:LAGLIDADG family homing endonuclease [Actinomadura sp. K4S16]